MFGVTVVFLMTCPAASRSTMVDGKPEVLGASNGSLATTTLLIGRTVRLTVCAGLAPFGENRSVTVATEVPS